MDHRVPDSRTDQKKSTALDSELVELIWRNGHVVQESHSDGKPSSILPEFRQESKFDPPLKYGCAVGCSSNLIQGDEPSPWLQDPLDDSLDREFSEFFSGIPEEETIHANFGSGFVSILSNSRSPTDDLLCASGAVGELSSVRTSVRSNSCRSNQADGSDCSFGKTVVMRSAINQNHKRKERHTEDSECHNEEGGYESIKGNVSAQRTAFTRKSRAAEVHNLTERRRRERINEKMKALQELIPHCNKSDKASMLDEAIQYMKTLQLQLQMMWMRSGMAQMMFPSAQQYMPRTGIEMGHASMPLIDNPLSVCPSPLLMQNAHVGFPQMQSTMNLYSYGSHAEQQNQTTAVARSSSLWTDGILSKKIKYGWSG